jgi:hypothetical protein
MADNPYAPPKTHVEDLPEVVPSGGFLREGRGVRSGQGWRWIADAWAMTRGQRLVFIGVLLVLTIVSIAVSFVPLIGSIASAFLSPFLGAGFAFGCDVVRRGGQLEVAHLFAGFERHTGRLLLLGVVALGMYFLIGIVVGLVLAATIGPALFGGSVPTPEQLWELRLPLLLAALIGLALLVPMTMALLYVPTLIMLNDAEVFPAVKASFVACLKNVVPFLIWGLAGLAMLLVSSPVILIGPLLVWFLLRVSLYMSYRDIFYDAQGE